jgi:hypothetical protein
MLHHLSGGAWGFVIRRALESGARTLLLMALLFIPLLFGLPELYLWARPEVVAGDALLQHKSPYLNAPFFITRTAVYFLVWIVLAALVTRWSLQQDRTASPSLTRRLQLLSGPGLVLYALTMTFASIDWAMSLEPHWFSTIYGVMFIVGQVLSALALMIPVAGWLAAYEPLAQVVSPTPFHDLGNLLLAFVMLWAYMAFSQYLIIWSGNLPEEIPWYLHRMQGGWQWLGLILLLGHFVVPFCLLLSRRTKRRAWVLSRVAIAVLCMRLVDLFWLVVPAFHPSGLSVHWLDIVAPVGVGGLWVAAGVWQLRGKPLLPLHDPRVESAFARARGVEHA